MSKAKETTEPKASKKAPKAQAKAVVKGTERSHDLPWNGTKLAIFKALKSLKALDAATARSAADVVAQAGEGVNAKQVRHYAYHAKAAGLVEIVTESEAFKGYGFYLTKAGAALKPDAELKAQEKAKADKPAGE